MHLHLHFFFYLSVNVFSTKVLIGDTIFTSPMQITTRDITWQENLIRRFPVKYEIAIKQCNVNKT